MGRLFVRGAAALAVATACTTFGTGGGDEPAPQDAAAEDAASETIPSGDAQGREGSEAQDEDASRALLTNGGFEESELGMPCVPGWSVNVSATGTAVDFARSGKRACRVCNTGQGYFGIGADVRTTDAGQYTATAWFHADRDAGVDARTYSYLALDYSAADGSPRAGSDNAVDLGAGAWLSDQRAIVTDGPPSVVHVVVGGNTAQGECVIVDDVSLVYSPAP